MSPIAECGRVELPKPAILPAANSAPAAQASGKLALYARNRAGLPWLDAMRANGRDFSLQPHLGLVRPANWLPSSGATITTEGMSNSTVGTVSTPGLSAGSLANSMRRWRLTSAATADSAADQRSGVFTCWRGNAAGLGGWTFVTRISLSTLQATGTAFFGVYGSTAALATTLTLSAVVSAIGIGFQRGTHTRWQLVTNDASGAPTLVDMGASFAVATGGVLTVTIAAAPNASSVWVRVVDEVSGAVFEQEVAADLPTTTQFLAPRLFINNGDRGRRRLRLRRRLPRDRLLKRPVGVVRPVRRSRRPVLPRLRERMIAMTPPRHDAGLRLSDHEFEAMLGRAAEEGARRALSDVGLGGKDAVLTIHDMRSLLECIQFVRRTAVQTAVHVITTGALIALLTGIAMKLRWFGPN
jgi:hypothetical protein